MGQGEKNGVLDHTRPQPHSTMANTIPTHNTWSEITICLTAQAGNIYRMTCCYSHVDWMLWFPVAWLCTDFLSGCYHWLADSYRTRNATINAVFFDNFQLHHAEPYLICQRPIANVNWEVSVPAFAMTMWQIFFYLVDADIPLPSLHWHFLSSIAFWISLTNQAHRWAHQRQTHGQRISPVIQFLQSTGILLSPTVHRRHHRHDHLQDYCITSGACNVVLDRMQFWRRLEYSVYCLTGKESYAMLLADKEAFAKSPFGNNIGCSA